MTAGKYETTIELGTNWSLTLSLKRPDKLPIDLTGYQVKSKIRKSYTDPDLIVTPVTTILDPPCDGKINLSLNYTVTRQIRASTGVYDIIAKVPTGQVIRLLQGPVNFSPYVTEWDESHDYDDHDHEEEHHESL